MLTVEPLDNGQPATTPTYNQPTHYECPAQELRAGWVVPNGVLEDQLPTAIYVSTPDPRTPNSPKVRELRILAFEFVPVPRNPAGGFWQVTYRACV